MHNCTSSQQVSMRIYQKKDKVIRKEKNEQLLAKNGPIKRRIGPLKKQTQKLKSADTFKKENNRQNR